MTGTGGSMTPDELTRLREWLNKYGPSNGWAGTFGGVAATVHRVLVEREECAKVLTEAAAEIHNFYGPGNIVAQRCCDLSRRLDVSEVLCD